MAQAILVNLSNIVLLQSHWLIRVAVSNVRTPQREVADSERKAAPSYRRTVGVTVAIASLLLSVGYAVGKNSAPVHQKMSSNHTDLGAIIESTNWCYTYAGVECSGHAGLNGQNCEGSGVMCVDRKC